MADIAVWPARAGMNLSHPVAGPLADDGGMWPEDQFTFRRIQDGDVTREKPAAADAPPPSAGDAAPDESTEQPAAPRRR